MSVKSSGTGLNILLKSFSLQENRGDKSQIRRTRARFQCLIDVKS
jgi:hypothetical protein